GVGGTDSLSLDGVLFLDSAVRVQEVIDGAAQTLMVGERPPSADADFGWWYAGAGQRLDGSCDMLLGVSEVNFRRPGCDPGPYAFGPGEVNDDCHQLHFWSLHFRGANF